MTTTNPDGTFVMNSFDPNCNRYEFSTSHRGNFWLPIGDDVFYLHPNGTKPVIQIVEGKRPAPVLLRLEQQGGEAEIRVFDKRTGSFIYAGLSIRRQPVGARAFPGSVYISTGKDGSSLSLFQPPGTYTVSLEHYICAGKTYFVASSPTLAFTIKRRTPEAVTLKIDTGEIRPRPSYDNPGALQCSQSR